MTAPPPSTNWMPWSSGDPSRGSYHWTFPCPSAAPPRPGWTYTARTTYGGGPGPSQPLMHCQYNGGNDDGFGHRHSQRSDDDEPPSPRSRTRAPGHRADARQRPRSPGWELERCDRWLSPGAAPPPYDERLPPPFNELPAPPYNERPPRPFDQQPPLPPPTLPAVDFEPRLPTPRLPLRRQGGRGFHLGQGPARN